MPPAKARLGTYISSSTAGEKYKAFVPPPLPPEPPLDSQRYGALLERAGLALGRLNGLVDAIPETKLFLYFNIRKEAVLSSQIEGTQSSLSDLLMFESDEVPGVPLHDVTEVSNYVLALEYAFKRIKEGFPLSLRLMNEMHALLLSRGRGSGKNPGEFRRSQNWIGGTRPGNARFVPPPPEKVMECLAEFEKFLYLDPAPYPPLVKAALAHVQFETIHPYLDGNGRLGRLLVSILLCLDGVLKEPVLYLSLYFKNHRQTYYDKLGAVRETGDWEGWVEFFLEGVIDAAEQAVATITKVRDLLAADKRQIDMVGRKGITMMKVHAYLQKKPITSALEVAKELDITPPTARVALQNLERNKIVKEITGRERGRLYVYQRYIAALEEGTGGLPE